MAFRKSVVAALVALALICTASEARAVFYSSFATGAWNVPANWTTDGVNPAGAFPGAGDDAYLGQFSGPHTITLDASRTTNATQINAGNTLNLNGFNIDGYYGVHVLGSIPDNGTITAGPGDGLGAFGGGSITRAFFTVNAANGINFWGGGSGLFTMAHGTADRFQVFSDNPGEVFRVLQTAGQTDGLSLTNPGAFPLASYSNTVIDLVFDGGSTAGDWAFRVEGNQVANLLALNSAGRLTWSGAPGITVYHDVGLDQTFVGIQASETVPEPSTLVLAALGLAGLGLVAWRRRNRIAD